MLPNSAPFRKALPLHADVPVLPNGKMDDFVDDVVTVGYHNERWRRLAGASLLSVHIFSCPMHSDEPLPREDLVVLKKFTLKVHLQKPKSCLDGCSTQDCSACLSQMISTIFGLSK